MKHLTNSRAGVLLATGLGVGLLLGGASQFVFAPAVLQARAEQTPQPDVRELRQPLIETNSLDGRLPDQAHAMADVGYHFANLWFAADKQNWPLANYYLGETRSHLRWAVRIHPVRQTKAGEVDLKGILDAVDKEFPHRDRCSHHEQRLCKIQHRVSPDHRGLLCLPQGLRKTFSPSPSAERGECVDSQLRSQRHLA